LGVLGVSIVDLLADLLGEGELHVHAVRSAQDGFTLGEGLGNNLDGRNGDTLLLREILTRDPGQRDGLVDTGLDGLRVHNVDGRGGGGHDGDIVTSLLSDLLAVVVSISVVSVSGSGLAHCHHLGVAHLLEGDLDSLGGGSLSLGLVGVGADLVINLLSALSTDSTGHGVALLDILDGLAGELNGVARGDEVGCAHLSGLLDIKNGAVVLGLFIAVVNNSVVGNSVVGHGMVGNSVVGNTVMGNTVGNSMVGNTVVSNTVVGYSVCGGVTVDRGSVVGGNDRFVNDSRGSCVVGGGRCIGRDRCVGRCRSRCVSRGRGRGISGGRGSIIAVTEGSKLPCGEGDKCHNAEGLHDAAMSEDQW